MLQVQTGEGRKSVNVIYPCPLCSTINHSTIQPSILLQRYRDDDIIGRDQYNGEWFEGVQHGKGAMTFKSGDVYRGDFR